MTKQSSNQTVSEGVLGKIVSINGDNYQLELFTDDMVVECNRKELPAAIANMNVGDHFTGHIRWIGSAEKRFVWVDAERRPPLRDDPGVWDDFDKMSSSVKSGPQ